MVPLYEQVASKIDELWEEEIRFLQDIGRFPSTLGNEADLQRFITEYLQKELQLEVDSFVPNVKELCHHPGFSPVEWSYNNRPVVVGIWRTSGPKIGKSVIFQGHIDVVSPEPTSLWKYDPWGATIVGNKMYGRGIQDMKSGVAAMIFALKAIRELNIELGADVLIQSVIEEECTGNGALAALERGYTADGALIPEPFGLKAVTSQVGVIWVRVKVTGSGAHTERADQAVNAIEKAYMLIDALKKYEEHLNEEPHHPDFTHKKHPLNINIGTIRGGDWPSNVPSECTFEARIGFYPGISPNVVKKNIIEWLEKAAQQDEWLRKVQPEITFYGFHAEGVSIDDDQEIFKVLEKAHTLATGEKTLERQALTCTTDIRFFNLYYGIPATCYGPIGSGMHGVDEWVDLDSVKTVTKSYAAFLLKWCGVRQHESITGGKHENKR